MSGSDGTVGKALEVLDQVAGFGRPVRFSELLAQSGHPKATLYRLVQTLVNQHMLTHDAQTGAYSLGMRLVRLAHAAWSQAALAPIARQHLDKLARMAGETVHLAQLDAGQVLYVDKRNAAQPVVMFSQAGKIGPAYCTGVGKAMLAHLPKDELDALIPRQAFHQFTTATLTSPEALTTELERIRAEGFARDREEHEPGIICVALPILTTQGRVLGALSVTGATSRTDFPRLEALVPTIRHTAEKIASEAEYWHFPETAAPALTPQREKV